MTTFALVHGAWHGAWCWERLVPELQSLGHTCVAVDLPAEDWSAGCLESARVVVDALDHVTGDVVAVGHSLGGIILPAIAALRPVRRLVFVCALVPRLGKTMDEVFHEERDLFVPGYGEGQIVYEDGSTSWETEAAIGAFFHDCPPAVGRWASSKLRRQVWATTRERYPLQAWPSVETSSILGRADRCVSPAWSRRVAREWLGVNAIELPGGHSPFLARPAELAWVLSRLG